MAMMRVIKSFRFSTFFLIFRSKFRFEMQDFQFYKIYLVLPEKLEVLLSFL